MLSKTKDNQLSPIFQKQKWVRTNFVVFWCCDPKTLQKKKNCTAFVNPHENRLSYYRIPEDPQPSVSQ